MNSYLVGEPYRDYPDPQFNTHVQRTWVYGKEKSLKVAEDKITDTALKLGNRARPQTVAAGMRKRTLPTFKIGDGPNTLPLESTIFHFQTP